MAISDTKAVKGSNYKWTKTLVFFCPLSEMSLEEKLQVDYQRRLIPLVAPPPPFDPLAEP
jgi:hypothetical protein